MEVARRGHRRRRQHLRRKQQPSSPACQLRTALRQHDCAQVAAHAKAILKIVVGKDEVREIGELPEGKYKWGGAIAGANGDVYCFPSDTERVLKVIPTPSHVLGRISPIFPRFFPFFARFHRLDEAVPTSPEPESRAKKQRQGRPNTVLAV